MKLEVAESLLACVETMFDYTNTGGEDDHIEITLHTPARDLSGVPYISHIRSSLGYLQSVAEKRNNDYAVRGIGPYDNVPHYQDWITIETNVTCDLEALEDC